MKRLCTEGLNDVRSFSRWPFDTQLSRFRVQLIQTQDSCSCSANTAVLRTYIAILFQHLLHFSVIRLRFSEKHVVI